MKRPKLGDVYYIKVPNGIKLYQWSYSIPRKGDYIRVFAGLYKDIPHNIDQIVDSQHSYIISFYAARAYRVGISRLVGNYPVPPQFPFPKYQIRFSYNQRTHQVEGIHIMNSDGSRDIWKWFYVTSMSDLPDEFRDTTLLSSVIPPAWLLYLFDNGFDLSHPERFCVGPDSTATLRKYTDLLKKSTGDGLREP